MTRAIKDNSDECSDRSDCDRNRDGYGDSNDIDDENSCDGNNDIEDVEGLTFSRNFHMKSVTYPPSSISEEIIRKSVILWKYNILKIAWCLPPV